MNHKILLHAWNVSEKNEIPEELDSVLLRERVILVYFVRLTYLCNFA